MSERLSNASYSLPAIATSLYETAMHERQNRIPEAVHTSGRYQDYILGRVEKARDLAQLLYEDEWQAPPGTPKQPPRYDEHHGKLIIRALRFVSRFETPQGKNLRARGITEDVARKTETVLFESKSIHSQHGSL